MALRTIEIRPVAGALGAEIFGGGWHSDSSYQGKRRRMRRATIEDDRPV